MLTIPTPASFNFHQTITMLQRGAHDPLNKIQDNTWTRCFHLPEQTVLIATQENKVIQSTVLVGKLDRQRHQALIEEALGLDDPIIQHRVSNIPYAEKIETVLGLSVPGYPDLFEALVHIIMGQQVSVAVANKVRANFANEWGGNFSYKKMTYTSFPRPQSIFSLPIDELRKLGLSQVKCKSILQLSEAFHSNEKIQRLDKSMDKHETRQLLTSLYGVGDWTVDWLMLRGFRHFDLIPATDLAVRKAFTWWLNKKMLMSADAVKKYEKKLFPYGGVIAYRVLCAYSLALARGGDN